MKKLFAILIFIILLTGCDSHNDLPNPEDRTFVSGTTYLEYRIIKIEECEYIWYKSYGGAPNITHKGNCINIIHKYQK